MHIENGKLNVSEYMSESIDLSLEDSVDEADMNRRTSIDLDELQVAHEKKSVDSIMLEVILFIFVIFFFEVKAYKIFCYFM